MTRKVEITPPRAPVVLDIDGTTGDFNGAVERRFGPPQGSTEDYGLEQLYPGQDVAIREFVADPETYAHLRPIPGARTSVRAIHDADWHLIVVTARPKSDEMERVTKAWVNKYFRGDIKEVHVVPFEEKPEFIKSLMPWAALDDSPFQIEGMKKLGVPVVVFDQPWNRKVLGVPRVHSWLEFKRILLGR